MKALTLHQPRASLVALGVKSIETRAWSTRYRGPLAIHAAVRPPTSADFGDSIPAQAGWIGAYNLGRWAAEQHHADPCDCDLDEEQAGEACMAASAWEHALFADEGAHGFSLATTLPLGAIVATCTLADVVPMVGALSYDGSLVLHVMPKALMLCGPLPGPGDPFAARHDERVVTDQRPYGDFAPGRFAWLLEDVQPTTERCPACRGEGLRPRIGGQECEFCRAGADRGCLPIPAKGRQGLWEWTP